MEVISMKNKLYIGSVCVGVLVLTLYAAGHEDTMHSHVKYTPVTLQELERFHGHVGPYVVLGSHMGEHAYREYGIPRFFGLTVTVEGPQAPPPSCLIDGLQWSTGATYGKHNIVHVPAERLKVTIKDEGNGQCAVYTLKEKTVELLKQWEADNVDVPERGERFFNMKAEDLFDIQHNPGEK